MLGEGNVGEAYYSKIAFAVFVKTVELVMAYEIRPIFAKWPTH